MKTNIKHISDNRNDICQISAIGDLNCNYRLYNNGFELNKIFTSIMDGEDESNKMSHLQSLRENILEIWAQKQIDQCYQDTVLAYLAGMNANEASIEIIKEHEKIMENKSQYYKIKQLSNERTLILTDIYKLLKEQSDLQQVCEGLDQLRKINLKVCESILGLKQNLQQRGLYGEAALKGYSIYFAQLNIDNQPIVKSYLNNFVSFTLNFDPFFLFPYEKLQVKSCQSETPHPILKLFNMNISYVYRLIKAKNQIIKSLHYASYSPFRQQLLENNSSGIFRKSLKNSQLNKQENQNSQNQEQESVTTKEKKKEKAISPHHRKFKTIVHDQQLVNQPRKKLSFRRKTDGQSKSLKSAIQQQQLIAQSPKFKIRRSLDSKKVNSLKAHTQIYDQSEDDDINAFRKKMLERKTRRKISLKRNQVQQIQEQQQQKKISNLHLNLSKQFQTCQQQQERIILKRNIVADNSESSEDEEEIMQSRNIQQGISSPGKIKLQELKKIKEQYRRRKERIKLQPLYKLKQSDDGEQQEQNIDQPKERAGINSLQLKFMSQSTQQANIGKRKETTYFSDINKIDEVNKQSSSGDSEYKNQTAFSKQNQDQLRSSNNKTTQLKYQHQKQFRLKKVPNLTKNSQESKKESFIRLHCQSERFTPIKTLNQQNFADKHMRRKETPKQPDQNSLLIPTIDIKLQKPVIKNKFEPEKVKNQSSNSPSRIQFHKISSEKPNQTKHSEQKSARQGYKYKGQSQSNYPSTVPPQRIIQTANLFDDSEANAKKKQIQMKPGQIKLMDLFAFIQKQKINDFKRKQFETGLWKQNITLKHSYLTKFYMDSELTAFGISSPRSDGDYSILYWGTTCAEKATIFMFKKYIDYLQKFTSFNKIYIGNQNYANAGFQKVDNCYIRKRLNFQKREQPYIPFLSLECSNIHFQQKNDTESSIFYSEQIQQFSATSSSVNPSIGFCDKKNEGPLPSRTKFYEKVSTISDINNILQTLQIDTYATSEKIVVKQISLFALKDSCSIKSNYFYVYDGYFAPKGIEVYSNQKSKILRLQMQKQEYFIYFGKKFQNVQQFVNHCSLNSNGPDRFFAFKMFSKQLYGRLKSNQYISSGCYGNWDISFLWQDQLKGTVIKDMPSSQYIFGPDKFYVAIFKSEQLLFAFEVKPSDFFF